MKTAFLLLDDDKAVQLCQIVQISAMGDDEIDPRTGHRPRPIPAEAQTRIDTTSGYFWTSTPYTDVIERIVEIDRIAHG